MTETKGTTEGLIHKFETIEAAQEDFLMNIFGIVFDQSQDVFKADLSPDHLAMIYGKENPTTLGKRLFQEAIDRTLQEVLQELTTLDDYEVIKTNDLALRLLKRLVVSHLKAVFKEDLKREETGYDMLMPGFIQKNSSSGLYQRTLEDLVSRAIESQTPVSVAFLDLDNFKGVNNYGQHVGDVALTHMANIISHNLRGRATAIRWGGEEIVLLFEGVSVQSACEAVHRINSLLNARPVHLIAQILNQESQQVGEIRVLEKERFDQLSEDPLNITERRAREITIKDPRSAQGDNIRLLEIPLSASIGVVDLPTQLTHLPPTELLDMAVIKANDLERYAKEHGRNQVCIYAKDNTPIQFVKIPTIRPLRP